MDIITLDDIVKEAPPSSTYVNEPYIPIKPAGNVITNNEDNIVTSNPIVKMVEEETKAKKTYLLPTVLSIAGVYIAYKTLI